jgi:hypothetical protein
MIGKITIGKSFRGCLLYCLNDKREQQNLITQGRAEALLFNMCFGSQRELIEQFNDVRKLNPRLLKPVLHITLSLAPGELLSKDTLTEICEHCARDMGFGNNQYVAIQHSDTDHQHLHIVANRIGFDKRTVSDSNNYQKIANFCRKMELKYKLTQVSSPARFLSKEERKIPRHDSRKERLKKRIQYSLQRARNYAEFEKQMIAFGYQVVKGRGISFIDDKKVKIKGSDVGFSLATIEKIFALKQEVLNKRRISFINTFNNDQNAVFPPHGKNEDLSFAQLQKQITDLIYQVTKPEQNLSTQIAAESLNNQRKKKRSGQHL